MKRQYALKECSVCVHEVMAGLGKDILGPFATLRSLPINVLRRDLDIAGLAVDATMQMLAFGCKSVQSSVTYFWALIWNLTPNSLLSSSMYSYTPAGQKRFSTPLY